MRSAQKMLDDVNKAIAEFNSAHNPPMRTKIAEGVVSLVLAFIFLGVVGLVVHVAT